MSMENFDPKLRVAMQEIVNVMKKHDIGGFCMLISQTHAEFKWRVTEPSWSVLKQHKHGKDGVAFVFPYRIKNRDNCDSTMGMLWNMRDMAGSVFMHTNKMVEQASKVLKIEHTDGPVDTSGPDYEGS